jgi:hypothetical protein
VVILGSDFFHFLRRGGIFLGAGGARARASVGPREKGESIAVVVCFSFAKEGAVV